MARNEKTGARVAKIAAKVLAMEQEFDYARDLDGNVVDRKYKFAMISEGEWRDIRALAASALTQVPDKPLAHKRGAKNQRHLVRVKAEGFDNVLMGPVELLNPPKGAKAHYPRAPLYDDRGFDPRDGGKVGKQRIPKQPKRRAK